MAVELDCPRGRAVKSDQQFQQRGLAAARRSGDRDELARLHVQIDVLQHELVRRAIAERRVPHLDRACHLEMARLDDLGFRRGGDDVGQAIEVQTQQPELDQLIDKAGGAVIESLPKRQEREQHAHGKALGRSGSAARPDRRSPRRSAR
jgi:hypothetical protein